MKFTKWWVSRPDCPGGSELSTSFGKLLGRSFISHCWAQRARKCRWFTCELEGTDYARCRCQDFAFTAIISKIGFQSLIAKGTVSQILPAGRSHLGWLTRHKKSGHLCATSVFQRVILWKLWWLFMELSIDKKAIREAIANQILMASIWALV